MRPLIEELFCRAERVTLAGSMTPAAIRCQVALLFWEIQVLTITLIVQIWQAREVLGLVIALSVIGAEAIAQPNCINGPSDTNTVRQLPAWSSYRNAQSLNQKNEYLFYDKQSDEVVVYFPELLNDLSSESKDWIEFRWQPQFLVSPVITATVRPVSAQWYEYNYRVLNNATAKREIGWFTLVAPITDTDLSFSHPTWSGFGSKPTAGSGAAQAATLNSKLLRDPNNLGRFIGWFAKDSTQAIQPKGALEGFTIRSRSLPGIITAYANSDNALRINVLIPPAIHSQIIPFLAPERNFKAVATIGPKFQVQSQPAMIAKDFQQVLDFLFGQGCLVSESPFMQEVLAILEKSAQANSRFPIQFRAIPSNYFEAEIGKSVEASLSLQQ